MVLGFLSEVRPVQDESDMQLLSQMGDLSSLRCVIGHEFLWRLSGHMTYDSEYFIYILVKIISRRLVLACLSCSALVS